MFLIPTGSGYKISVVLAAFYGRRLLKNDPISVDWCWDRVCELNGALSSISDFSEIEQYIDQNDDEFASRLLFRNSISGKPMSERRIRAVMDFSMAGNAIFTRWTDPVIGRMKMTRSPFMELLDPLSHGDSIYSEFSGFRKIARADVLRCDHHVFHWATSNVIDMALDQFESFHPSSTFISGDLTDPYVLQQLLQLGVFH